MKIAVCDDNQLCRDTASELLQHYAAEHPDAEITIFSYEHADDLMDAARKTGGFDIYILDIIEDIAFSTLQRHTIQTPTANTIILPYHVWITMDRKSFL